MSTSPTTQVTTPGRPTPQQLVEDPDSLLHGTFVRRHGARFDVTAVWACDQSSDDCLRRTAIAHSGDGFATAEYSAGGGTRRRQTALAPDRPTTVGTYKSCAAAVGAQVCLGALENDVMTVTWTRDGGASWDTSRITQDERLIASPVPSVRASTFAVQWGGDGATLFPFERVSRSTDSGRTWSTLEVDRPRGVMPYSSGSVVLADGRLIALLDNWSDDRRAGKPGDRVHGLYASDGSDWSSYSPMRSTYRPALHDEPRHRSPIVSIQASADPDPVIWVTTWDKLLYVSTDDARSFRQVRAR